MAVYNNPALGQSFENIAALFAPPSSADLANYATAAGRRQQNDIVAKLAQSPEYAGFDHQAILADLYDPTQSFYRVNTDDATARRGQDITASTSRANNAADNRRQFITSTFGALNQGQVRPEVPGSISGLFGVDQALPAVAGAPKPMSESEVKGDWLQQVYGQGLIKPEDVASQYKSETNIEQVEGPNGPLIVSRDASIGMEPYVNKGAQAKPENAVARLRDGTQVPAIQGPDGAWRHAQTNQPLPADIQVFRIPQPQGTAADVGLGKPVVNNIQQQLLDISIAKDTAVNLRDLIATSPASQGVVGFLRGTAQNLIQTGGELGTFFGGGVAEVAKDINAGIADAGLAGAFDPNIPAIEMMANLLAFQYAKTTTGERLSNEMLRAARQALGLDGLDANQANSLARLDQAIAQIESQENILRRTMEGGLDSISQPAPPSPQPTGQEPVPQTQAEFDALPPGAVYRDPDDGQLYRKP